MTVAVALIAIGCVSFFSFRSATVGFREYTTKDEKINLERIGTVLAENYERHGDWKDVQATLNQIGNLTDKQILLIDAQGKLLGAYPAELAENKIQINPEDNIIVLQREREVGNEVQLEEMSWEYTSPIVLNDSRGKTIGSLYVVPQVVHFTAISKNKELSESATNKDLFEANTNKDLFINSLNQTLLFGGLTSVIIALVIAFFLSRRILRPIEALTSAVRKMESGNLSQRVNVSSKDEIGELARAFNSMAGNLVRVEQLRQNMVNDVAHELRTPLTNIRCQIESVQDGLVSPTPDVIDSLYEEAMLLNRLIDDLQDMALAEAGQLALKTERISVGNEVRSAINSLKTRIDEGKLEIKVEIPKDCPDVLVDSKRFGQVLRNLLNNAITHSPVGGTIKIQAAQINSHVEIMIEDTGYGISPNALPLVFERFYRADASRNRATGGSGLGLAIVKQIVEAHGGATRIESQINKGTKIFFTLPIFKS
ncbi:MAG TPA: ATP-binding protein [Pyrinomonadaceae bacterium]|jgi:signal transduction histidine kinase